MNLVDTVNTTGKNMATVSPAPPRLTIDELKKRSTASEFALIEVVERILRQDVLSAVVEEIIGLMQTNPLPSREDIRMGMCRGWIESLEKKLNEVKTPSIQDLCKISLFDR